MKAILTDIEGTTSSIAFVKDVLFPYARAAMPGFVERRGGDDEVRRWLDVAAIDAGGICKDDVLVEVLQGWIDADRKHTALKALQGMIWDAGYRQGAYTGHVYPDTAPALEKWKQAGHEIYVYSSGSVAAQKLLFGHSDAGDLTPLLSGHFDTEVGGKREVHSYERIAQAIGRHPSDIVFLSDVVEELDAAREAGLATVLLDRPEDYPEPRIGEAAHGHHRVASFADLNPDSVESAK
jgi:enolase-phosphatase E1